MNNPAVRNFLRFYGAPIAMQTAGAPHLFQFAPQTLAAAQQIRAVAVVQDECKLFAAQTKHCLICTRRSLQQLCG